MREGVLQAVRELEGVYVAQPELHVAVHHQLGQAQDLAAQMEGVPEAGFLALLKDKHEKEKKEDQERLEQRWEEDQRRRVGRGTGMVRRRTTRRRKRKKT
jgi:hypothetical protein